jgi:hypothetical protein
VGVLGFGHRARTDWTQWWPRDPKTESGVRRLTAVRFERSSLLVMIDEITDGEQHSDSENLH